MSQAQLFENMRNPSFYGSDVETVDTLQTHISFVALVGSYAYKVKKAVNFGFLDFSTLEKRKHFCEEELRLNRRLCPEIYLDVVPITKQNKELKLDGKGEIVDYAVKMKRFPQENMMVHRLKQKQVSEDTIEKLCDILVKFYQSDETTEEINSFGRVEAIKKNVVENFEQTTAVIDLTIPKKMYHFIQKNSYDFFDERKTAFEERMKQGHIHDCHGDLHSGNIVINDGICIFDCIEFNKRFRYCDVASDIGFLAMDLDFQNKPFLSSFLMQTYIDKSNDNGVLNVLNLYKSYRAYVRGKVLGFRLDDPHVPSEEKNDILETASRYYELSHYYASLLHLDLNLTRPLCFMISGITGTGKSTLARKLSIDYHAQVLNSDMIRKQMEGVNAFEHHYDGVNKGLYSPKKTQMTYESLCKVASELLHQGNHVIVDATFQQHSYREELKKIAEAEHAVFVPIGCTCPDMTARQWLDQRLRKKTVSDGRWEIYLSQKKTFEAFTPEEQVVVIDMADDSYEGRMASFRRILARIQEAR
jgi:aminoglycoside phosphotransferase family enzyme/predicted kinase